MYRSSAVMAEGAQVPLHVNPRESHAMPGTRAPHYWLQHHGQQISTLDLFERNFTLLAALEGAAWCDCAAGVAKQAGLKLDVLRLGQDELHDPSGGFPAAYGLEPSAAFSYARMASLPGVPRTASGRLRINAERCPERAILSQPQSRLEARQRERSVNRKRVPGRPMFNAAGPAASTRPSRVADGFVYRHEFITPAGNRSAYDHPAQGHTRYAMSVLKYARRGYSAASSADRWEEYRCLE